MEIVPSSQISEEIVKNASRFTEFLSSENVVPVRKSISIIPNVVADILDVALKHKTLRIQDSQFRRKAELALNYLKVQDNHSQRQFRLELERIHSQTESSIVKIEQKREIQLAQIKMAERTQLRKIASEEKIRIAEMRMQHELELQRLKKEKDMFYKALHERSKQFNAQMRKSEKLQAEFMCLINVLSNKIMCGTAVEYDYKMMEHLASLKVQALDSSFDVTEGFLNLFVQGE